MTCLVCKKSSESIDCFNDALEILKQHFIFYKNSLCHRDEELQNVKERNERLNKALELLQTSQQPSKKFKTQEWVPPPPATVDKNSTSTACLTDISLTDDDDAAAGGFSNLNMALNSEQLFETSIISPAKPEAALIISASEMVVSPRAKLVPRRIKQKENIHVAKDRNKLLEKSKSEWNVKDSSSLNKSWAMALLKPSVSSVPKPSVAAPVPVKHNVGVNKKPEKKLNLSLKKVNPCKIKQSILPFNSSKDSSAIESDFCEDIIDASPVVSKSSRAGKSLLHRSGHNLTSQNSSSPTNTNNSTSSNNTEIKIDDNNQKPDETVSSMPIENIVFDFSPTKKQDVNFLNSPVSKSLLSPKQLNFNADVGNDTTTDCVALSGDQSILSKSGDSSSVVLLTPATQDIIFLDDTNNDLSDINTMDLLADIQKHETEYMENLKRYESKNIEKKQKQEVKPVQPSLTKKEDKEIFIKPVASIKREKHSQTFSAEKRHKIENDELPSTSSKRQKFQNPLLASEPGGEEEDEEDSMPQPFIIKEEPKDLQAPSRKLTLMERLNIDCQECEKLYRILGPSITDRDLEMHLRRCTYHNRPDIMRQNTPDNFWNPFILSFDENDPRNEVLIDTRFKDRNMK